MDLFKQMESIAANQQNSEMKEIFLRYQRKEITHEEYITANAHGVAANLQHWRPEAYQPIPPDIAEYIDRRLNGILEANKSFGVKLGAWLYENYRLLQQNTNDYETLVWAMNVCRRNGLATEADRIQFFLPLYERLEFNYVQYGEGCKVQVKDSYIDQAKQRAI